MDIDISICTYLNFLKKQNARDNKLANEMAN